MKDSPLVLLPKPGCLGGLHSRAVSVSCCWELCGCCLLQVPATLLSQRRRIRRPSVPPEVLTELVTVG